MQPAITSIAAVEVVAFPTIKRGALWASSPGHGYFIHFSGGYYVEVDAEASQETEEGTELSEDGQDFRGW